MNNNSDIVISTNNLSKVYKLYKNPKDRLKEALSFSGKTYHKDFYALKNINLEIRRGEVIGIVGKNGSGKSTLLKILSRVLTPTSGEFMVKGKVSSLLELGSGFNPELTGIENIFFYATILGIEEKQIKEKLQEILDFADIGDFVYQPLKTYSSGMKARLAFSVAINVDPDILILDEVLAVGDELFRRKCYARMEGFFKGKKTILFVSHSVSDINQLCTRSVMLDRGEFLIEGPSKLVTAQYQRYLFSTKEKIEQVRKEIVEMNNDTAFKDATYAEIHKGKQKDKATTEPAQAEKPTMTDVEKQTNVIVKEKAYYIPGLVPKSRMEYKNYDVEITDVSISTLKGEKVNVLSTGEKYNLFYNIMFKEKVEMVNFGMMIKTEKGMDISGSNSVNFEKLIPIVEPISFYQIKWEFTCNLLAGNYYLNIGVHSLKAGDWIILAKIVDVLVFKVERQNPKLVGGILNLNQSITIKQC
jgi:lipopolysaccharide transport system ATP-binding protein